MARYRAQTIVPYTREQMFDLVADVESYPRFVPWWIDAKITGKANDRYKTLQTMGLGPVRLRFASETEMIRPENIHVMARGGGLKHLELTWRFEARPDGCQTSLEMEMVMSSRTLDLIVSRLSKDAARTLVDAFCARARTLYEKDRICDVQDVRRA